MCDWCERIIEAKLFSCHKGKHSRTIPVQCCALPYTLNGGLYYNCTVWAVVCITTAPSTQLSASTLDVTTSPADSGRPAIFWMVCILELNLEALFNVVIENLYHEIDPCYHSNEKLSILTQNELERSLYKRHVPDSCSSPGFLGRPI